jgi:hypothetical protein
MAVKLIKWPYNLPTSSVARHFEIYLNLDFLVWKYLYIWQPCPVPRHELGWKVSWSLLTTEVLSLSLSLSLPLPHRDSLR